MKDFDRWNVIKKQTDNKEVNIYFRERQIWWCKVGVNIGHEEDGKGEEFARPVLVLKKYSRHTFLGLLLTSKIIKHQYRFRIRHSGLIKNSDVILSQARTFDDKRLLYKLTTIDVGIFNEIKNEFKDSI